MQNLRQAGFVSAQANLRAAQVKRSGRSQNKARAVLRAAEQVQDGLDGER
ncbi:MAG: hypothetical protein WBG17_03020 [Burkholderiaceae bacterium]